MAKSTKSGGQVGKTSFGKKRKGVAKKHKGPKEKNVSPYRGQGR